ncbi:MAG: hypothetical protein R3A47_00750 [Polyangiales bacterium]
MNTQSLGASLPKMVHPPADDVGKRWVDRLALAECPARLRRGDGDVKKRPAPR